MRRFLYISGLCCALAAAVAAVAGAAPVAGGTHVQLSLVDTVTTNFLDGQPDGSASFLPDQACGFAPAAGTARLTADVRGWQGPPPGGDPFQNVVVSLNANVEGTVGDVAGRSYHLSGTFSQNGLTTFPLPLVPFDGVGRVTIAGAGGTVTGSAAFRIVQDFPLEWDFWLTGIRTCTVR